MRFLAAFTVFALGVVAVSATEPETTVARLIADAWQPQEVRVEWQFTGPTPKAVADYEDWAIAEPRPTRLAGSLIVVLERSAGQDQKMRLPVSGTARVYGPSLMPTHTVHIGEPVDSSKVTLVESEWTRLKGNAAQWENLSGAVIAARTLVPGRSIVVTDLKPEPLVRRNQSVQLEYEDGAVKIRMAGRALQDGAIGEIVTVAVEMGKTRRFEGTVAERGIVRLVK